jgi:hypothetical protein
MRKLSPRGLTAVSSLAIALAVILAPATAAADSTRPEYIAQVDPICQSYQPQLIGAFKAYHRAFKVMNRRARSGTLKAFVKSVRRTAATLSTVAQLHANLIGQIAAVPPPMADAAIIATWLDAFRREQSYEVAATTALRQFKIGPFFQRLNQADGAVNDATTAISGYGFTVCGVTVT